MLKWEGDLRRGKGKRKRKKRSKKWKQNLLVRKRREIEGKGGEWEKRRSKIYQVQVQVPYDECDHYLYLICTKKINFLKRIIFSPVPGQPSSLLPLSEHHQTNLSYSQAGTHQDALTYITCQKAYSWAYSTMICVLFLIIIGQSQGCNPSE